VVTGRLWLLACGSRVVLVVTVWGLKLVVVTVWGLKLMATRLRVGARKGDPR
jgi:hypothetical protein